MRSVSTDLPLRVRQATPEQQAAIERILAGQPLSDTRQGTSPAHPATSFQVPRPAGALKVTIEGDPGSGHFCIRIGPTVETSQAATPEVQRPSQPRYALRREGSLWHLTFDGQEAVLRHEQGVCYVAEMFSHPGELIKKLNLAAKFSSLKSKGRSSVEVYDPAAGDYAAPADTEPVHEASLAADDDEARRIYYARARELKETLDDPTETEAAKAEAQEELEQITAHLSKDNRQVRDPTKAAADAIRIAIKKLLQNLLEPGGSSASPRSVGLEFAEHVQRYLVTPSRRYAAPEARKARGEFTGCLLYEPPSGISWAVRQ